MTIEIREPELEALIEQRMASGRFNTVEDALREAFEMSTGLGLQDGEPSGRRKLAAIVSGTGGAVTEFSEENRKVNLADFLLDSPLHGSGLVVERVHDHPREVDL